MRKAAAGLALLAGAAATVVVAWRSGQDVAATVVALLVGLPALALAWQGYRADRADARAANTDVANIADRLADQVRWLWAAEAARRGLNRPPLEVSWQPADRSLSQPWADLQRRAAAGAGWTPPAQPAAGPHELAGRGGELTAVLARVPTGRLVVLGEPGAGKTMLLVGLVLDLLARRTGGGPVPLLVPLASFDPARHDLDGWLENQLARTHPWLAGTAATGASRARALIDAGLVLPVLDGLDEIRPAARGPAVVAINTMLRDGQQLVLSCRAKAFRHAIRPGPARIAHVEAAAAVRLDRLDPARVAEYLTETVGSAGTARWAPVLAALAAAPPPPVARALSTPLMASLARTVYNPAPGEPATGLPDPGELCDTALPTRTAVEEHLFDGFVPAAYRPHPGRPARWDAARATPYLVFLARHLEHRLHTTSLAWWELPRAMPRALPALVVGLPFALAIGLATGFSFGLSTGLVIGPAVGLVLGLVAGGGSPPSPRQVALRRPPLPHLRLVLAVGLVLGLVAGLVAGLAAGLALDGAAGLAAGLPTGLAVVLAAVLAPGLGVGTTADTRRTADPWAVLTQDRASALVFWFVGVLLFGLMGVLGFELPADFGGVLVAGLVTLAAMPIAALMSALASTWGRLGLARLWLASRGHQPLHLMAFLADAHERGVLRQAGAVWEFRHANLQRRLANKP